MNTVFSSRRFNQDTSAAKRAAEDGPVYVTDRGRPSHVLMTFEEYARLTGGDDLVIRLGSDAAAAAVDLPVEAYRDLPRAAQF